MGAANGMNADGSPIDNVQAKEVWAGTTLGFAALLESEGMKDEAYKSTWGLYHVIYETKGYWFRTPEAWDITGNFRAGMYMRPAGIWAMEMTAPPGPARPRPAARQIDDPARHDRADLGRALAAHPDRHRRAVQFLLRRARIAQCGCSRHVHDGPQRAAREQPRALAPRASPHSAAGTRGLLRVVLGPGHDDDPRLHLEDARLTRVAGRGRFLECGALRCRLLRGLRLVLSRQCP